MPTRTATASRQREVNLDFANVGEQGRRTGVVLAPRTVDENGLENMTGMFSSPAKETPASNKRSIMESIENDFATTTPRAYTPAAARSTRKSVHRTSINGIRSASPRKSGITGSARRIGNSDVLADQQLQQEMQDVQHTNDVSRQHATNNTTPQATTTTKSISVRPATVRRFSPEKTPLRNKVLGARMAKSAHTARVSDVVPYSASPRSAKQVESPPRTTRTSRKLSGRRLSIEEIVEQDDGNGVEEEREEEGEEQEEEKMITPSKTNELDIDADVADVADASIEAEGDVYSPDDDVIDVPDNEEDEIGESDDYEEIVVDNSEPFSRLDTETGVDNQEALSLPEDDDEEAELPPIPAEGDDEDDQDFEPEKMVVKRKSQLHKANSRRKRKSDAMEEDVPVISSPSAKRAKRRSEERLSEESARPKPSKSSKSKAPRKALANKSVNNHMSESRRKELDEVVDRIRSRPGQNKSLIVLRRETPADDAVTHTRSGRVSIKPLAWWKNEGVVYGDSPGGITNGQRFPLNSIKEIIRSEEADTQTKNRKSNSKSRASSKTKPNKGKERASETAQDSDSDADVEDLYNSIDAEADDWELDSGTFQGSVSVWDNAQQAPVEEDETVDIAYAPTAMQTKAPKGSSFRYARILSTKFFGTGIVELPPGAAKKPKNSRKMHMGFFVAQGRVTVQVGAINGPLNKFSIGKGGFWQVPRGNQYSIENELEKPAKIFFSQACDTTGNEIEE